MLISLLALACQAIDGDTLRCGGERYRLLGIDAPEMPGHCRKGRECVLGDPWKSKDNLARLVAGTSVSMQIVGRDRYGRALVIASVASVNLSCAQIKSGNAVYISKWDNSLRIAKSCPP